MDDDDLTPDEQPPLPVSRDTDETDLADLRHHLLALRRRSLLKLAERLKDGTLEPGLLEVVNSVHGTIQALDEEIVRVMQEKHSDDG
jgi:hypothetical protein